MAVHFSILSRRRMLGFLSVEFFNAFSIVERRFFVLLDRREKCAYFGLVSDGVGIFAKGICLHVFYLKNVMAVCFKRGFGLCFPPVGSVHQQRTYSCLPHCTNHDGKRVWLGLHPGN